MAMINWVKIIKKSVTDYNLTEIMAIDKVIGIKKNIIATDPQ